MKMFKTVLSRVIVRGYSSALFIPANKAQESFRVLTPYFDFEDRIKDKPKLEQNVKARGLNLDVNKIEKYWCFYKSIDESRELLELTKIEIGNQITQLMKEPVKNEQEINKLKIHAKLTKGDLKNVKDYLYGVEEHAIDSVLSLPCDLHPKTPTDNELVIHTFLKPKTQLEDHVSIAVQNDLVEIIDRNTIFLKGEAALFEIAALNYFSDKFLNNRYIQFSNADFVRSVVIEGCGTDFRDPNQILTLEDKENDKNHEFSRIHLVGGASIYSFMAYFTKHQLQPTHLPLNCYAVGRRYNPVQSDEFSFFDVRQDSALQVFIATLQDDSSLNSVFEEVQKLVVELYENLGFHFRLVYLPAKDLHKSEALRLSIQMQSCHLQSYVEVGNLSICDDYISKRLLFTYSENKERKFPKIITGSVLNVCKLLGCVLEYNKSSSDGLLNDCLKKFVP